VDQEAQISHSMVNKLLNEPVSIRSSGNHESLCVATKLATRRDVFLEYVAKLRYLRNNASPDKPGNPKRIRSF